LDGQRNERKASLIFLVAIHEVMKKSLIDFFVLLLQQVHFYYNDAQKNFIIMLFTLQIEQACVSSKFKKKLQKKNVDNNHLVTKKRMIEIGY
jgi:hypothetical protein